MKQAIVERVEVNCYRIPTEERESDGTYRWEDTVLVAAHIHGPGEKGFGYSYASPAAATLIQDKLGDLLRGRNALDIAGCWLVLTGALRNLGNSGIGMMAVSALDAALWDLKARLLGVPLVSLLGEARERIPVYGSGGFTSCPLGKLQRRTPSVDLRFPNGFAVGIPELAREQPEKPAHKSRSTG